MQINMITALKIIYLSLLYSSFID